MDIQFHYTNFKADKKLLDLLTTKINKLKHFYDKIIDVNIFLKVENSDTKDNKHLIIKMNVAHHTIVSEEVNKTFENAIDLAEESLKIQLIKYKEKLSSSRS